MKYIFAIIVVFVAPVVQSYQENAQSQTKKYLDEILLIFIFVKFCHISWIKIMDGKFVHIGSYW